MKKILLSAVLLSAMFTACKKDDDNDVQTRHNMLIGTWNLSQYGMDANNNGTMETGEAIDPALAGLSSKFTFHNDGTGFGIISFSGMADSGSIKWSLINNENTLRVIEDVDTTDFQLKAINSSSFTLLDTSAGMQYPVWEVFQKQ